MSETPYKRRWFQFSLRSLFVVMTLIAVLLAWFTAPLARRHAAIVAIEQVGGKVTYAETLANESWFVRTLRDVVPKDCFDEVIEVDLSELSGEPNDAILVGLQNLTGLKELSLAMTPVTDARLIYLKELTGLQGLYLHVTRVTDAGLAHLGGLKRLKRLNLSFTNVSDAGLVHLKGLTQLKLLDLYSTQVTDEGVATLQQALPGCKIEH